MKTLDKYLDEPGFYISSIDHLIVVNDRRTATILNGYTCSEQVHVPENWEVVPVKMKRFYFTRKPEPIKRKVERVDPLGKFPEKSGLSACSQVVKASVL